MKKSKKCTCGAGRSSHCNKCSAVRMVICLKNGYDHLKYSDGQRKSNPVWYSFLKHNTHSLSDICAKMEKRLRHHATLGAAAQVVFFYDNKNRDKHIKKIKV